MSDELAVCPSCELKLRIRDRRFVGQQIACPDCRQPLQVGLDPDGNFVVSAVTAAAPSVPAAPVATSTGPQTAARPRRAVKSPTRPAATATPRRPSALLSAVASPLGIAWIVAGCFTAVLLVTILFRESSSPVTAGTTPDEPSIEPPITAPDTPPALPDSFDQRLAKLGAWLLGEHDRAERFPAGRRSKPDGSPAEWSWLSGYVESDADFGLTADLAKSWDDPSQDRFVRRSLPAVKNPNVKALVGDDGRPASHIVGLAGIGEDGPTLPVDHPRAGVFGLDRGTRRDDILDGVSQTAMATGVEEELGSWSAPGQATIRPLTAAPWLHGPDGFGTGAASEMLVLMADGSVRAVSSQTEFSVVQDMVTIAGIVPEPTPVSLEPPAPQVAEASPTSPPMSAENSTPDVPAAPIAVAAPPEKAVSPTVTLELKLLALQLPKPVPLSEALLLLEEMSAQTFDRSDVGEGFAWEQPVRVNAEDQTLGSVLAAVLEQAALRYEIEDDRVKLRKRL